MKKFFNHEHEELIRTIDSMVSIVLQIAQIIVTSYGLWFVMHHSR